MKECYVLYGAGARGKRLCKILRGLEIDALTLVDSDSNKWGTTVEGYPVEPPEAIERLRNAVLCVAVADEKTAGSIRDRLWRQFPNLLDSEVDYYELLVRAFQKHPVIQRLNPPIAGGNQKNQILFDSIYSGFGLGGVEAWTADICTALRKDGAENVYILAPAGNYEIPAALEGCIRYIDTDRKEYFSVRSVLNAVLAIAEALPCKVVVNNVNALMLAARLVKERWPDQIEIISVAHNEKEEFLISQLAFKDCVDGFVGVSLEIQEYFIAQKVGKERVFRMQIPFSCEEHLNRVYTEDADRPLRLGYAGRIVTTAKRMDLLLRLAETLKRRGVPYRLELAGTGEYEEEVKNFLKEHQLEEQVCILGQIPREEIPAFWQRQDICVNLADYEGRSISIIEAMGNGAVPIVTATSGVREDIEDGVNGYIVPLRDYRAVAGHIEYLASHRSLLPQMGGLAHKGIYPKSLMEPHVRFWKERLDLVSKPE